MDERRHRAAKSMKAFRASYRRIDYYPAAAALAVIDRMQAEHPALNIRQVLDGLVTAGERYFRK